MLRQQTPEIWTYDFDSKLGAGVILPARMVIVRLPDGSLLLHSPGPIAEPLRAALCELGEVRLLLAPNLFHHMHLRAALQHFPGAEVLAPHALTRKYPQLELAGEPGDLARRFPDEFTAVKLMGADKLDETVFYHCASRTLICTDLVFNIHRTKGLLTPLVLKTTGTYKRFAQSRAWAWTAKDKPAFGRSLEQVLALPSERLIPAHGDIVKGSPVELKALLQMAFWRFRPVKLASS